jgi:hypothetical protein
MTLDLRPLTLPELLDRSFSTYKRHVWLFVGIMAVPAGFALAYSLVLQAFEYANGTVTPDMKPEEVIRKMAPVLIALFVFMIAYTIVYAFALGATTIAVAHLYKDQPVSVGDAYRAIRPQGLRLVLLFIWATVKVGLAWMGLIFLTGILAGLVAFVSPLLSPLVFFLGMLVSFVLIAYFAVRYAVCVPAAVLENLSPNRALKRSVELTEDHRGRIFLILLCAVVVTWAAAALLQGPFMVGALIAGPGSPIALALNVIGAVLGAAGSTFTGPIMIIGLAMAYYDLRIRKEALDLQMMLEAIDAPRA